MEKKSIKTKEINGVMGFTLITKGAVTYLYYRCSIIVMFSKMYRLDPDMQALNSAYFGSSM